MLGVLIVFLILLSVFVLAGYGECMIELEQAGQTCMESQERLSRKLNLSEKRVRELEKGFTQEVATYHQYESKDVEKDVAELGAIFGSAFGFGFRMIAGF